MVFIINNLKYDTDKMELISKAKKFYPYRYSLFKSIYGTNFGTTFDCDLYRSSKGNWLLVHKQDYGYYGEAISESEAKTLLLRYNSAKYEELFGKLEEA